MNTNPYFLVETPFGRFMAKVDFTETNMHYYGFVAGLILIPIGELEELPVLKLDTKVFGGEWGVDHEKLREEGIRLRPEYRGSGFNATPFYVVNGKQYRDTLHVQYVKYNEHAKSDVVGKYGTRINTALDILTDAAETKISEWMIDHLDDYVTGRSITAARLDQLKRRAHHAQESAEQAYVEYVKNVEIYEELRKSVEQAHVEFNAARR